MKREELTRYLDNLLEAGRFRDYCPNGLQVEGRPEIRRLVAGVSATQALLDAAIERDADAILVHHGWFWRGEDGRVTGMRKTRLQTLLSMTSTSSPIICRSTAIPNWATTRSWPGASAGSPTPLRRAGSRLAGPPGAPTTCPAGRRRVAGELQRAPLLHR
jgi:hypothetical protein